jgi:hypothetical protein
MRTLLVMLCVGCGFEKMRGAGDLSPADSSSFDLAPPGKRVFATAQTVLGDMNEATTGVFGLLGGDLFCNRAAVTAGIGGSWRAWLSDSSNNAFDRVLGGPWYRTDGQMAFANRAALASGPLVPLDRDENGSPLPADQLVFTGTGTSGQWAGMDCAGWSTSSMGVGVNGDADSTNTLWTIVGAIPCNTGAHLYCFEQ